MPSICLTIVGKSYPKREKKRLFMAGVHVIEKSLVWFIFKRKHVPFSFSNYVFNYCMPHISSNMLQLCVCGFLDKWTSTNQVKQVLNSAQRRFSLGII